MTVILIHRVAMSEAAGLRPVGVWAIDDDHERHHYPDGREKYESRGFKALFHRPDMPATQWALYKADTSPNWEIHQAEASFDFGMELDLEQILADAEVKAAAASAAKQAKARHQAREAATQEVVDAAGWGAPQRVIAHSWWVASELARRHPELLVYEEHPGGGMYDVLAVAPVRHFAPNAPVGLAAAMLNRVGTLQIHAGGEATVVSDWATALTAPAPFDTVLRLEAAAGWSSPASTPSATRRSLAYRFLAASLNAFVNDRHDWDARCELLDSSDGIERNGYLKDFPEALADLDLIPRIGIFGEPHSHFWALMRDGQAIAIVSIDGRIYPRTGASSDLLVEYEKHGRRIRRLATARLRDWL
ncbi:hypothetical protein L2X99_17490 [Microbacterium sp. KUDC0406]|uniref:TY-Chap2 family putative peptide chaperone n=1 Tax=Microbacterium sp. KUDC0406 TaxID=2909588 RepID=UPI001F35F3EC|nr:hypothetical protein [Microbacterium sp. KUDC0406]UJP10115.1 hypothetical protein L2X99_17490 [Microbacterium sp. KUDC0406]